MSQKRGDKGVASLDSVSLPSPPPNLPDRGPQMGQARNVSAGSLAGLLRAASEVSGRINAILDPDELLGTIIPLLNEEFGFYYVHIYVLDVENRMLRLRAGYGDAGRQMLDHGHKIPLDAVRSLVAQVARTRAPVVVGDVSANDAFLPNPLLPDTRSEMALPMVVGEDVLGVLDVQDDQVDAFSRADQDVLFTLCGQIATALQNARHVERIAQSLTETSLRLEITQALSEAQTQESVLDALIAHAALEDVLAVIELFDEESDEPTFRVVRHAASGSGIRMPDLDLAARLLADDPTLREWFAQSDEFVVDRVREDTRLPEELRRQLGAADVGSLLALPLRSGDQWLGLMMAMTAEPEAFSAERRLRYLTLVEQGAVALRQAQLRDRLSLTQFSVDQAPVAIFWIRPDGTLYTVNDTACDLLGYARSELLSLPAISRLDPNMIPGV
jgi:GAF domain-containing protein